MLTLHNWDIASGDEIGSLTVEGDLIAPGADKTLEESVRGRAKAMKKSLEETARWLDGWSNGYAAWTSSDTPP